MHCSGRVSTGLTPNPGQFGLLATLAGMGNDSCTGPWWDSCSTGAGLRKEGGEKIEELDQQEGNGPRSFRYLLSLFFFLDLIKFKPIRIRTNSTPI
jgi:hypothetical protein